MIKIVCGVYGDYTTGIVVAKNKDSAPFELPEEEEKRLVDAGVAVYVDGGRTALPEGVISIPEYSTDMKVDELRAKHLLTLSEGAYVVDLSADNMPPCIILKSDGTTLYALSLIHI